MTCPEPASLNLQLRLLDGWEGKCPGAEAADLGALRGRRRKSRANSCHALSHPPLAGTQAFCSVESVRSRVWEFSVEKILSFLGKSAFASSGGRLLEVLLAFGKCVGCGLGVVTTKICRLGSELSRPPTLPF